MKNDVNKTINEFFLYHEYVDQSMLEADHYYSVLRDFLTVVCKALMLEQHNFKEHHNANVTFYESPEHKVAEAEFIYTLQGRLNYFTRKYGFIIVVFSEYNCSFEIHNYELFLKNIRLAELWLNCIKSMLSCNNLYIWIINYHGLDFDIKYDNFGDYVSVELTQIYHQFQHEDAKLPVYSNFLTEPLSSFLELDEYLQDYFKHKGIIFT